MDSSNSVEIYQPNFLRRLADASEHSEKFDVEAILRRLDAKENLCDLANSLGLLPDPKEEEHLRTDWYGPERWWKDYDVEGIVRRGYFDLLSEFKSARLPIEPYWITGVPAVQARHVVSKRQITFFLLTPPPGRSPGPFK